MTPRRFTPLLLLLPVLSACLAAALAPPATAILGPVNLDGPTQALIAAAKRVAFIVPFSHWDTDWHDTYANYAKRSDGNLLAAIQLARQDSRYRYTFEQVLFVQHFWDGHPEARVDLSRFVKNRQFTFAWAGLIQPETSLTGPAIQIRNLQLGRRWITDTFGAAYLPHTAWQSDAFGNSAALPIFLTQSDIPYLFIGRWQHRCDPDYADCQPLPHLFYWSPPAPLPGAEAGNRVLAAYLSYPAAWDAIHRLTSEPAQIAALRTYIETQFARTNSNYVFIPMGSDFIDPLPNLMALVDRWNAASPDIKLVVADPETAFQYIATQPLPSEAVDLNPIWQAFYATRPFAKIADKESEFYLTAADKFGVLLDDPTVSAWPLAATSVHYDNIGAVSFDGVWQHSQLPRFQRALAAASGDLATILGRLAARIDSPFIVFNSASWTRREVIEVAAGPQAGAVPAGQQLSAVSRAIQVSAPACGWAGVLPQASAPIHPAAVSVDGALTTLSNGLVSVTLDAARGGAFTRLSAGALPNLLPAASDDITYWRDNGDVYGASFGAVVARESQTAAQIATLAGGPLLARAQAQWTVQGQTLTKTVTLRADSPLVEVSLSLAALPNTSVIVQSHTSLTAATRTDDLGFAAFNHLVDNSPIVPGDRTYRREIFYPFIYWSDIADTQGNGLALLTHGLQGLGGAGDLNLLLVRDARVDQEGVTDTDPHTFRYAYLPHARPAEDLPEAAYAFNQPLIPVLKTGGITTIGLPFISAPVTATEPAAGPPLALTGAILSAEDALVVDLYRDGDRLNAVLINYSTGAGSAPATLDTGGGLQPVPAGALVVMPVTLDHPPLK